VYEVSGGGPGADSDRLLAGLPLAADERLIPGGAAGELARSLRQLRLALGLSLLLVFLTVAALYESFRLPLAVMATVPVALAGAAGLLAAAGESLNVLSFLGLILLTGIVVNNSIVLLHRSEQLRQGGLAATDAVRAAAAERYRPILLTSLTTLAGMLPLALVPGDGAELRRALALAVAGGVVAGTVASLLLVPALYRLLAPRERSAEAAVEGAG
jgi:multidrug efflux pump subunit AcrB